MQKKHNQKHDSAFAESVELMHRHVQDARTDYGLARFRLGYSLLSIKEGNLWEGKAESFWDYVDDLKLNRNACRNYMKVAQKFFVDLQFSDEIASQLAACNMSVLQRAADVITIENASDVLSTVLVLRQNDALVALDEFDQTAGPKPRADDVSKVLYRFKQLPDDRRIEFLHQVNHRAGRGAKESPLLE